MPDEPLTNNSLRIGVKRIGGASGIVEPDEPAVASLKVLWAEMAGVMLPESWQNVLLSVDYHADGQGFHTATITFGVSDFETVDWRTRDAASSA